MAVVTSAKVASILTLLIASTVIHPMLKLPSESPVVFHQEAFTKAMENLLQINTVPYDPKQFDRSGLLHGQPGKFIRAGGGYDEPWTRDAAINSWNAASLIEPDIARNTLYSVLDKNSGGLPIVQRDNQWWDKVIWTLGAWNHYVTTGDREFLETGYGVTTRLLAAMHKERFDAEFGLYQGPSFFNDGIAGYPEPPAPADDSGSSFVLDHPGTDKIMALSTNCLYLQAYRTTALMAKELGRPHAEADEFTKSAEDLKKAINHHMWIPSAGLYGYLIHGTGPERGKLDPSEEGTGLSFAVLFDVASKAQAKSIIERTHIEPRGITDVYPCFPRYAKTPPGRHNVVVWPMVQGMWARAAVHLGALEVFDREMKNLATLALATKGNFYEIYDSKTGAPEEGWQVGGRFINSQPHQTWSATAYLSMVMNGVFGLRFEPTGLHFEPTVPTGWSGATLSGIQYRGATLEFHVSGMGTKLKSVNMDGKALPGRLVPPTLTGDHTIELVVG